VNSPIHIVLVEPEIPPNTGNIARLCACAGITLHLVHPLGFAVSDRQLKRAGLDYWQHLDIRHHRNWQFAHREIGAERNWYGLTTRGETPYWDVKYGPGDVLAFGPETRGLSQEILSEIQAIKIPMRNDAPVRSLNLSSACSIVAYEALRQLKTLI